MPLYIIDAADIDISQPEERIVGILPESCLGILVAHYEKTVQYRNLKLRHANPPTNHPCQEWKREEKALVRKISMLNDLLWFSIVNEFPDINDESFGIRKNEKNEIIVVSGSITPETINLGQLMAMMAQSKES